MTDISNPLNPPFLIVYNHTNEPHVNNNRQSRTNIHLFLGSNTLQTEPRTAVNEVFTYVVFRVPAVRAVATAKAVKWKKPESEKIQTPYSTFDEKEMNKKIVL